MQPADRFQRPLNSEAHTRVLYVLYNAHGRAVKSATSFSCFKNQMQDFQELINFFFVCIQGQRRNNEMLCDKLGQVDEQMFLLGLCVGVLRVSLGRCYGVSMSSFVVSKQMISQHHTLIIHELFYKTTRLVYMEEKKTAFPA